jgi:TolA-binding protein
MKVSKEQLKKIIQEELSSMQQEGEVDEALGTFFKSLGGGVSDVAKSAASGISDTWTAAKAASKKADEEAAKAKEEAKLAAQKVKTSADVEAVIGTALKQVKGTIDSLETLIEKMQGLEMSVSEPGLDLPMIVQKLKTAGTALYHGGKKTKELKKGQAPQGFKAGDERAPPRVTSRPRGLEEQEEE